jgi:hypothetical protein
MRFVPDGVHREALGDRRPAEWYRIWYTAPGAECVCLGRTRRLRRHLWHRCFPETGEWPEDIKGWVAGVEWLLKVHESHRDAS